MLIWQSLSNKNSHFITYSASQKCIYACSKHVFDGLLMLHFEQYFFSIVSLYNIKLRWVLKRKIGWKFSFLKHHT